MRVALKSGLSRGWHGFMDLDWTKNFDLSNFTVSVAHIRITETFRRYQIAAKRCQRAPHGHKSRMLRGNPIRTLRRLPTISPTGSFPDGEPSNKMADVGIECYSDFTLATGNSCDPVASDATLCRRKTGRECRSSSLTEGGIDRDLIFFGLPLVRNSCAQEFA
jgi:hypothetical protein